MRLNAVEAMTITLCFLPGLLAPLRRSKLSLIAPGEERRAAKDLLDRARLTLERAAVVVSLWPERNARQCAVTPRYELAPGTADFSRVLTLTAETRTSASAPAHARALLERLSAAGFSAAEPGEAASFPETPAETGRRAA